jgi:hypothetical protein
MAQGRRVRRVLRKIDTFSLAKMAFLFHLCMSLVLVVACVLLWTLADGQGLVDQFEKAVRTNLSLDTFSIEGKVLFRAAVAASVLFALLGTGLWILGAFLFNLLSDLVGGVQVWVLEEVLFDQAQEEEQAMVSERPEPAGLEPAGTPDPQVVATNGGSAHEPTGRETAKVG